MSPGALEFTILGPLEVRMDGRALALGGPKQRALLADLILDAGRVVPTTRLIDDLWGDEPPASADHTVEAYISRLRRILHSEGGREILLTRPPGYLLDVQRADVDAVRFEDLVAEGDAAAARGEDGEASRLLRSALSLWRGDPLAGVDGPFAAAAAQRITERRLVALEKAIGVDLRLGRHRDLVPELEGLTAEHPYRESFAGDLMVALYRSGRQTEALSVYRTTRERLVDELGIEPGPELQRLERAVLEHDPGLDLPGPDRHAQPEVVVPAAAAPPDGGGPPEARPRWVRSRRPFRRTGVRVGIVLVAITAVAAVLPAVLSSPSPSPLLGIGPGLAILDARSGRELHFIPSSVVRATAGDLYAGGHYWVLDDQPNSFVEIDAKTGRELTSIASPVPDVGGFGVSGRDLWVTDNDSPTLDEIDTQLGRTVNRFTLSTDPNWQCCDQGGLVADGSVWVVHNWFTHGEVLRVDPATGKVQHDFPNLLSLGTPVASDGSVWMSGGSRFTGGVLRIDPATNAVVARATIQNTAPLMAAGGGFGWASDDAKGLVYKIDRSGNVVGTYSAGDSARGLSFDDGTLWAANQDGGEAVAIDAVTGTARRLSFSHPLAGVAAGSGTLLVDLRSGPLIQTVIDSLGGKVVRLLAPAWFEGGADPAFALGPDAATVEFATCAGLLRYPDLPSPAGWALQPEVASSMPAVSSDGRTYTYTIRPGYRFSPPSNQPVTAATFRFSIERALSPKLASPAGQFLTGIEGEDAYVQGKADHISGLQAKGDTLTITLTRPTPDFPERLAMPMFCPVPIGTPVVQGGLSGPSGPVPSTGPYYIARNDSGELMILRRNPNYRGPRPHAFDTIVIREGIDPGKEVQRVESGQWDGVIDEGPPLQPGGPIEARWGPHGSASDAQGSHFDLSEFGGSGILWLNAGRPLFAHRDVRLAVAYALDRPTLAAIESLSTDSGPGFGAGAVPSDEILPASEPESGPGPFPLHGPDIAKAKELMHGITGTAVLVASRYSQQQIELDRAIKEELAPIGIDVVLKIVPNSVDAVNQPDAPYDMKVGANYLLPPMSAAEYLAAGYGAGFPPASWFTPDVVAAFGRLVANPSAQAAGAFIRGALHEQAAIIGFDDWVRGNFFAPTVGCRLFPPASLGVDLAALCPAS